MVEETHIVKTSSDDLAKRWPLIGAVIQKRRQSKQKDKFPHLTMPFADTAEICASSSDIDLFSALARASKSKNELRKN